MSDAVSVFFTIFMAYFQKVSFPSLEWHPIWTWGSCKYMCSSVQYVAAKRRMGFDDSINLWSV